MVLQITDRTTEESMQMTYSEAHALKGALLRATIAYLEDLTVKCETAQGNHPILREILMKEGLIDPETFVELDDEAVLHKLRNVVGMIKGWKRDVKGVKGNCDTGGSPDAPIPNDAASAVLQSTLADVHDPIAEMLDTPYYITRIPHANLCPPELQQLHLQGLHHLLSRSDIDDYTTFDQAKGVIFLVDTVGKFAVVDHGIGFEDGEAKLGALKRVFGACKENSKVHWA